MTRGRPSEETAPDEAPRKGQGLERARAIWRRRWWLAAPGLRASPGHGRGADRVDAERLRVEGGRPGRPPAGARGVRAVHRHERARGAPPHDQRGDPEPVPPRRPDHPVRPLPEAPGQGAPGAHHRADAEGYPARALRQRVRRAGAAPPIAFSISYRGSDPQTVAQVANALASSYIEENLRARERQATGTAEFLRVQLEDTKRRLSEQEQKVSGFKRQHLGELPEQLQTNLSVLGQLNEQLRHNTLNQIRLAEKKDLLELQVQSATGGGGVVAGPSGEAVVMGDSRPARLARLRQELADLLRLFSDRYPDVQYAEDPDRGPRARARRGAGACPGPAARPPRCGDGPTRAGRDEPARGQAPADPRRDGRRAQGPEGRRAAPARRHRLQRAAGRQRPEAGAGAPGALAGLPHHAGPCTRP